MRTSFVQFHQSLRKRILKNNEKFPTESKTKRLVDNLIYIIAILGPIMTLPQLIRIWIQKDATAIALSSWIAFTIFSGIWLSYGILHKEKPIIITNFLVLIINFLIVIGGFKFGAGFF